jgi:hypothetical protein
MRIEFLRYFPDKMLILNHVGLPHVTNQTQIMTSFTVDDESVRDDLRPDKNPAHQPPRYYTPEEWDVDKNPGYSYYSYYLYVRSVELAIHSIFQFEF